MLVFRAKTCRDLLHALFDSLPRSPPHWNRLQAARRPWAEIDPGLKEVASLGRPCHNQSTDGKPQAPMTTVPPADIFATIYHWSGIDLATAITDRLGRPISSADDIKPNREVVG
jgi:hypothetical protein